MIPFLTYILGGATAVALSEFSKKRQMAEGGRVKKYPNLYEIQYDETVNDSLTKSKQLVLNEIDIVKKDVLAIEGKTKITSSRDAADIFYNIWDKNSLSVNENSYMLFLNRNNIAKSYYFLSKGGIDGTIMDVQIICGLAAKTLSKGVIVAHNHPSNNLKPSDADIRISRQIKDALNFLNVTLLDSLILTPSGEYTSLADNGSI